MSAEKYQNDEVSTAVIEDLFEKLHERAMKEFGKGWEHRRIAGGIATKALYLYVQPGAEELIIEYASVDQDDYKSLDDLDAKMTEDQRSECKEIDVSFEAERRLNEDTAEISTVYTLKLLSASALDAIVDVPEQIQDKVATKLDQAETDHMQKIKDGELDPDKDDDFNGTIAFSKEHVFVLREQQELLEYRINHAYSVGEYEIPMLTYQPDDNPIESSLNQPEPVRATPETSTLTSDQQHDDMMAMFDEIMRHQDIEKPVTKRPAELRVAQIMAILAILDHGEAQNEEQETIIHDLT